MNKNIHFLITKENKAISLPHLKAFQTHHFSHAGYNVYIWGLGDIAKTLINGAYVFSFPLTDSLMDHNLTIRFKDQWIEIENDWLGSIPIFYDAENLTVSTLPLLVLKNKTIDFEGLKNYLNFGYSVFEKTAFESVGFVRYFSKLTLNKSSLQVEEKPDPVTLELLAEPISEEEVWDKMAAYVRNVESQTSGEIILPLSGGYDSRLLSHFIQDKSRVRAFTYGISKNQFLSYEVVRAKRIAKQLGIKWQQIELGNYNRYMKDWFEMYGFSTHLHGMYHMEFYQKILETLGAAPQCSFASGIVGDAWAGSIEYPSISKPEELRRVGYSHDLALEQTDRLKFEANDKATLAYFKAHEHEFSYSKMKPIHTIRLKLILLNYLMRLPAQYGFITWTPYLNFDIAVSMLRITESRRKARVWQKDFLKQIGLNVPELGWGFSYANSLSSEAAKSFAFEALDVDLLGQFIDPLLIQEINKNLHEKTYNNKFIEWILALPKFGKMAKRFGLKSLYSESANQYYVLKAFEWSLKG